MGTRRPWLQRQALGLWFLGIAALGFMRWWQKVFVIVYVIVTAIALESIVSGTPIY